MQSHQSLCNRSIDASALGVWFDVLRGVSAYLSSFVGGFDIHPPVPENYRRFTA